MLRQRICKHSIFMWLFITVLFSTAMIITTVYAIDPVICLHAGPRWHLIDASQCVKCIDPFTALVRNPNNIATLTRVVFSVWSYPVMEPLGCLEAQGWIDPHRAKNFTADFDIWDPRWGFDGTKRMDYEVRSEVWYWNGPHWLAGIHGPSCKWFTITVVP